MKILHRYTKTTRITVAWSIKLISLVLFFIYTYEKNKHRVNGAAMVPLIERNKKSSESAHTSLYQHIVYHFFLSSFASLKSIFPYFTGDWVARICTCFAFFSFLGWIFSFLFVGVICVHFLYFRSLAFPGVIFSAFLSSCMYNVWYFITTPRVPPAPSHRSPKKRKSH